MPPQIPQPPAEFAELFAAHQRPLFSYIMSLVGNWDLADEIFQETCVVLLKKQDQFDPQRKFLTWACGIAHNEFRNHLRVNRPHALSLSNEVLERVSQATIRADQPDGRLQFLESCLEELGGNSRDLLQSCYARQGAVNEVATTLGMKPNTVSQRLARIRRKLFECISRKAAE